MWTKEHRVRAAVRAKHSQVHCPKFPTQVKVLSDNGESETLNGSDQAFHASVLANSFNKMEEQNQIKSDCVLGLCFRAKLIRKLHLVAPLYRLQIARTQ